MWIVGEETELGLEREGRGGRDSREKVTIIGKESQETIAGLGWRQKGEAVETVVKG